MIKYKMTAAIVQAVPARLATPIMPLFLLGRMAQRVLSKGQLVGQFVLTIPLLLPAVLAYTWGEFLGYLLGAGNALEHVE